MNNANTKNPPLQRKGNPKILGRQENTIRTQLYNIITFNNGKPDYLAIDIYLYIKSQLKNIKNHSLKTSYAYFVKKYKCSRETIRRKLCYLEDLGLVQRSFTTEEMDEREINNILTLSLNNVEGVA